MSEKKPPISMSMRWRVSDEKAERFKSELRKQGLSVQQFAESFTEAFMALPDSLRSELARQIRAEGSAEAGVWMAEMINRGELVAQIVRSNTNAQELAQ